MHGGGYLRPVPSGCPLLKLWPSEQFRQSHSSKMEIDFYLINGWRNILLHLAGTVCGKGALQTAGKSWALASLLLGQWKIPEARLPSATFTGSSKAGKTQRGTGNRASLYLPGAERSLGGGGGGGGGGSGGGGRHWQMC